MSNKTILQSNNDMLSANNLELQNLIDLANTLPEVNSGVELPKLSNEGIADDLVEGKELIDSTGNIITGTNPYEKVATNNAIAAEADLIAQIQTALQGKSGGSIETCTVDLAPAIDWELRVLRYSDGNEVVNFFPDDVNNRMNLTVVKNTMLAIFLNSSSAIDSIIVGDAEVIDKGSRFFLFSINGDCSIDIDITGGLM